MPTLAEILKRKFASGLYSKAHIAGEMGVSEKTIENYMNGKREPKNEKLIKLAALMGFSLAEMSEQTVPNSEQPRSQKVDKDMTIYNLSEAQLMLAQAVLNFSERFNLGGGGTASGFDQKGGRDKPPGTDDLGLSGKRTPPKV